jgi:hypothetical protein
VKFDCTPNMKIENLKHPSILLAHYAEFKVFSSFYEWSLFWLNPQIPKSLNCMKVIKNSQNSSFYKGIKYK